jgi:tartrate dehydratase beta subunit/fumarate hydratase class I family protein
LAEDKVMTMTRRAAVGLVAMLATFRDKALAKTVERADDGQPMPIRTRGVTLNVGGRVVTAIMRHWRPGDSGPGGRCKLCPTCIAYDDGCLILVNKTVNKPERPLFRIWGTIDQRTGERRP